jgi:hypothetical protein
LFEAKADGRDRVCRRVITQVEVPRGDIAA